MAFAYKISEQQGVHFVTCTVVQWIDVFTRREYADILVNSLKYCQKNKGLNIFAWVIMSNHIHLIVSCNADFDLSDTMRDFKKFTSSQIVDSIEKNTRESRRSWLLWLLKHKEGITFWQPGNHPEEIRTREFFKQKLDYIHQNPVRAGIVDKEEEYIYSSARCFYGKEGLIDLTDFQ